MRRRLLVAVLLVGFLPGCQALIQGEPEAADLQAFAELIREAEALVHRNYATANRHRKNGTLAAQRSALIAAARADLYRVFTADGGRVFERGWVVEQFQKESGPDLIDHGVTDVKLTEVKVSRNSAQVKAEVHGYLVDRIHRDGRPFLDRMEGKTFHQTELVKVGGRWWIAKIKIRPSLDVRHVVTPEE